MEIFRNEDSSKEKKRNITEILDVYIFFFSALRFLRRWPPRFHDAFELLFFLLLKQYSPLIIFLFYWNYPPTHLIPRIPVVLNVRGRERGRSQCVIVSFVTGFVEFERNESDSSHSESKHHPADEASCGPVIWMRRRGRGRSSWRCTSCWRCSRNKNSSLQDHKFG